MVDIIEDRWQGSRRNSLPLLHPKRADSLSRLEELKCLTRFPHSKGIDINNTFSTLKVLFLPLLWPESSTDYTLFMVTLCRKFVAVDFWHIFKVIKRPLFDVTLLVAAI